MQEILPRVKSYDFNVTSRAFFAPALQCVIGGAGGWSSGKLSLHLANRLFAVRVWLGRGRGQEHRAEKQNTPQRPLRPNCLV